MPAADNGTSNSRPITLLSANRFLTGTLVNSPAEAPKTTTRPTTSMIAVVGRNKSLLTELAYAGIAEPPASKTKEHARQDRDDHPVYRFWHGHISALIAAQRPDADADMIAHLMLGSLHNEPMLAQLAAEGPERLSAAMRAMATAVLDAPCSARA